MLITTPATVWMNGKESGRAVPGSLIMRREDTVACPQAATLPCARSNRIAEGRAGPTSGSASPTIPAPRPSSAVPTPAAGGQTTRKRAAQQAPATASPSLPKRVALSSGTGTEGAREPSSSASPLASPVPSNIAPSSNQSVSRGAVAVPTSSTAPRPTSGSDAATSLVGAAPRQLVDLTTATTPAIVNRAPVNVAAPPTPRVLQDPSRGKDAPTLERPSVPTPSKEPGSLSHPNAHPLTGTHNTAAPIPTHHNAASTILNHSSSIPEPSAPRERAVTIDLSQLLHQLNMLGRHCTTAYQKWLVVDEKFVSNDLKLDDMHDTMHDILARIDSKMDDLHDKVKSDRAEFRRILSELSTKHDKLSSDDDEFRCMLKEISTKHDKLSSDHDEFKRILKEISTMAGRNMHTTFRLQEQIHQQAAAHARFDAQLDMIFSRLPPGPFSGFNSQEEFQRALH
ncbi:hypothetical protein MGYG_02384 [Nannizzia gypsea CBS 118893]|uniref:Uncharacterized protein n=1 Tax=Arthroderma gypseum (strain ATCC MYA-4604 / CBS 118893) TaxID=535722 RepID=E4URF1_ARTGP|nr:hypothetical protein MGYG_02384 [Nannizzia gypsea CBS 118893]EFQ99373.1 hypothetical protein MGYG_02384 [Nannizzia gypsea CBS 118893]